MEFASFEDSRSMLELHSQCHFFLHLGSVPTGLEHMTGSTLCDSWILLLAERRV